MKKIISLLVVIALIAAGLVIATFAAGEPAVLVEKTEAKAGESVQVAVVMENNPGFLGMQLTVEYDDAALELTDIAKGEILVGNYDANPASGIVVFGADADVTASGTLLTLTFNVKETAAEGAHAVTVVFEEIYNEADEDVAFTVEAGSVTVAHVCDSTKFEDVAEVPAECEKEGTEAHQKCSCGKLYQNGVEVKAEDLVIEALNHPNAADAEYVCEYIYEDEMLYDLVLYCPDCGKELERHVPGTEMNPLFIIDQNYETMDVEYGFTAPAGKTTYLQGRVGDMIMTLKAEGVTVTVDGVTLEAVDGVYTCNMVNYGMWGMNAIEITNNGETDLNLDLLFSYPAGSMMNPDDLELSWNTAELPADSRGYFYNWTAEADGLLVIIMQSDNWTCVVNNAGAGIYGNTYKSDDEVVVRAQVVKVTAGDVIEIVVGTADYTAAAVEFTAAFTTGTAQDPVMLQYFWNEAQTEATLNVAMPAGEYICGFMRVVDMALTVDGTETEMTAPAPMNTFYDPFTFTLTGEEAAVRELVLFYPEGTAMNPDELEEGDNATEIAAGSQGYFYEWTAEEDGTVTITVSAEGGYFFCVNNLTTGIYGDNMRSDSEELVNPVVLEVKAGETIQVIVNTYDPEANEAPAGTVNVNFEFTSAPAKTGDPITMVLAAALISGMSVVALTKKKEN